MYDEKKQCAELSCNTDSHRTISSPLITATPGHSRALLLFRPGTSDSVGVHAVTISWVAAARKRLQLDPAMHIHANGSGSRASGGYAAQGVEETAPPFAESLVRARIDSLFRWNLQLHVHREVCALYCCCEVEDVHLRRNIRVGETSPTRHSKKCRRLDFPRGSSRFRGRARSSQGCPDQIVPMPWPVG